MISNGARAHHHFSIHKNYKTNNLIIKKEDTYIVMRITMICLHLKLIVITSFPSNPYT